MPIRQLSVLLPLLLAGSALAQTSSTTAPAVPPQQPPQRTLPAGLTQTGGVIMMAPIDGSTGDSGSTVSNELRPSVQHVLSPADHDIYSRAMDAGDHGDWIGAKGLAAQGHDAVATRIVTWRYLLDQNSGASFGEIDAFLKANPQWPSRNTLYIRAEAAMDPNMTPSAVVAWFGDRSPASGIGYIRLGEALIATGNALKGRETIRKGWIEYSFTQPQEIAIAQAHADVLGPDTDKKRMEHLLWRDDVGSAQRQMSRVDAEVQGIAQARLLLRRNLQQGQTLMSQLSVYGQNDNGLKFELARALRRAGQYSQAQTWLQRIDKSVASEYPKAWWGELNIVAREDIKSHDYQGAYALVNDTGLSSGTEFAEAEFLAGWLALRYLHRPAEAMAHFKKLDDGVSRPISRARAHYWEGRAAEDMGDKATAYAQYKLAAHDSDTYYGMLATAKLDATPTLDLADTDVDSSSAKADFEATDSTRAIRVLADLGKVSLVRTFAAYAIDQSPEPKHAELLAQMLTDLGYRDVAVRVGKASSYNGLPMLRFSYPVISVPAYRGPFDAPETGVVLALIRQETEFDPTAVSGPGAAGLMQMMPSSAKVAAQQAGLPYLPGSLTTDTTYNMQLGMTEFSAHLRQWGGSYIITAAAYNAGDSNASKWLNDYGDPRSPTVDPIDWIESIPFNETRNYVQRVIENLQVYRNRLAGRDQPLRIVADIYRPASPKVDVLVYTPPAAAPAPSDTDKPKKKRHHAS